MTASITLTPDTLIIGIEGTDKFWALKSRLQVPLANVAAVAPAESEAREWLHGIRVGGTHMPGVISAGRFYSHGKWVFWDVHDPAMPSASNSATSITAGSSLRSATRRTRSVSSGRPPARLQAEGGRCRNDPDR